jgi:ABC-2 type transport system ATP-binding protein
LKMRGELGLKRGAKVIDHEYSIQANGLTRSFKRFTAVRDLSLKIKRGEIYGYLGLNGAGKTTTIRMFTGMIKPSAGETWLLGDRIQAGQTSLWRKVGYMIETPHAYPDLTVRQNLEIIRHLRELADLRTVDNVITRLGLTRDADRRAGTLSLGNAQRLGLAKALIHNPELLILDEPANGLDPAGIVEIRNLLKDLAVNQGVTIFISSHILSEIARLANRIGIIHRGRLIKEFSSGELADAEGEQLLVEVREKEKAEAALKLAGINIKSTGPNALTVSSANALAHPEMIATLLVQAGCPPGKLVVQKLDLESYFLKLVGPQAEEKDELKD